MISGCASDGKALYIVDSYNHRLQKFNLSDGRLLRSGTKDLGSGQGQLYFPQGLSLTEGVLHVADTRNHRIVSFDTNLRFIFAFGGKRGSKEGELSFPSGVAVIGTTIYVADSGNDRIQVFSTRGKFIRIFAKPAGDEYPFDLPSDVSLAHGRVFVSEFHGKRVQVLTRDGAPRGQLREPCFGGLLGICVDPAERRAFAIDRQHNVVHVLDVCFGGRLHGRQPLLHESPRSAGKRKRTGGTGGSGGSGGSASSSGPQTRQRTRVRRD